MATGYNKYRERPFVRAWLRNKQEHRISFALLAGVGVGHPFFLLLLLQFLFCAMQAK